jgi:DNA-binding HxlR family transcriptional regulator
MSQDSKGLCPCPLEGVIDTISKKWALFIIHVLGNTTRLRFNELQKELDGISPKTLTDTLGVLQKEGFVGREAFAEIPPRVEYYLTDDGKELWEAIVPLLKYTMKRETFPLEGCSSRCTKRLHAAGHHVPDKKISGSA